MIGTPGRLPVEPTFVREGSGSPVLLIPGMLSSPEAWREVFTVLAKEHQVISLDLTGSLPPGHRGVSDYAQCWRDLMDYLELPAAHVVAHGSGCKVATLLALETPYRTLSLALVNPVIRRTETPGMQQTWHLHMLLQWLETNYGRTVRRPEHLLALEVAVGQQTFARFDESASSGSYDAPQVTEPDLNGLTDLDFPVLAINGSGEATEVCELTRTLYGRAPHFRYHQIPGGRHNCLRETPDLLARVLSQFLQDAENPVIPR